MRRLFALLPMLAGLSASALGQQSPFLTEDTYNKLTNEISGDVGEGTEESDYVGKDVSGKIVLAYGPPNRVKELACWARGAVGIVSYNSTRVGPWTDHPDQIAWSHLTPSKEDEKPAPPVFVISPRAGLDLSREMAG